MDNLYSHPVIREKHEWGQDIIETLFRSYMSKTALLPDYYQNLIGEGLDKARVVCDYIAGMTDQYAVRVAERLRPGVSGKAFTGRV